MSFDPKNNAEIFKDFYSNLPGDLVKQLPNPPNKYKKDAVKNYYKQQNLDDKSFSFGPTNCTIVAEILNEINSSKSAGIDNLAGKFLKEGAPMLAAPPRLLILSTFPFRCLLFLMIVKLPN